MKRIPLIAVMAVLAATASTAQGQVPIRFIDGIPVIDVQFDGHEKVLVLDTGAGTTVLDTQAVQNLDLEFVQEVMVSGGTNARSSGRLYRAPSVSIGDVVAEGGMILALDLAGRGGPFRNGIDGVFSSELGRPHLVEIDFPRLTLNLLPPTQEPAGQATSYSEGTGGGLPSMEISIDGVAHRAIIDSGAPSLLLLPSKFIADLSFTDSLSERGRSRTVNSENTVLAGTLDGTVTIAGKTYDRPTLEFVEGQEHIIIGMEALRELRITLDPANRRAWVVRE